MKIKLISFLFILLYVAQVNASHRSTYDVERWKHSSQERNQFHSIESSLHEYQRNVVARREQERACLAYNQQQCVFDHLKHTPVVPPVSLHSLTKAYHANHTMHTNAHISAIKADIDKQLFQLENMLKSESTYQRYMMVELLEGLATSFDSYYQTLQKQYQASNHDPSLAQNLYAVQCLREELYNLTNCITAQLFAKDGTFLDKNPDVLFRSRLKCFFSDHKNISDLIALYDRQYENGRVENIPSVDPKRLELIKNHPFNKALNQVCASLKQGNLDQANKICKQFELDKKQFVTLQSLKTSSQALNEYGMPKIWQESHPKWPVYKQELKANPDKCDAIIKILQSEHNKAQLLCKYAGIDVPTAIQLNYAHQLYQYHSDPSFLDIALEGVQDITAFEQVRNVFEQRACISEQIRQIAVQNPDSIPLLKKHMEDLLLCYHDPKFKSTINEMVRNPDAIEMLKQELLQRDTYAQEMRDILGCASFSGYAEQITYQLADAKTDMQRIDILSSLSIDHPEQGVQDAYQTFYDQITNLPKIFNYDAQLLETTLPPSIATKEFAQERTLYTQIMTQPIMCHEQLLQAKQCISFFRDACVMQESQIVYRDLACTAAKTYLNQSYNCMPADRMQQIELFDRAYRAVQQGDVTPADVANQSVSHVKLHADVNYQQLHDQVAQKCAVHQDGVFANYYQSREQALKQIVEGNSAIYKHAYELSPQAEKILETNGFDSTQFKTCTGNLLQQDTNAKFVQTLNVLAQKTVRTGATQKIKEGVLECAQVGSQLNQNGNLQEAMLLSDLCHVAVEYLWHGIDTGLAVGKGVVDGVYVGVSSELIQAFRDPHALQETVLTAGSSTEPTLSQQVAAETATIVSDLVRLIKDSGEIAFSGVAGVGDAIVGLPELVSNCLEVTKLTGEFIGRIGMETAILIDAAEREDVATFERHAQTMQHRCDQVAQGIGDYLTQLKAHKSCINGQITKADLKDWARSGGQIVAEGAILSNVLKGTSKIMKGALTSVRSAESVFAQLQQMKDISGAQVRNVLLSAQLEGSMPLRQVSSLSGKSEMVEQIVARSTLASEVQIPSFVRVAQESIAKSIIQQGEVSSSSSMAQKLGQLLSLEPKPGYILIPGKEGDKQPKDERPAVIKVSNMKEFFETDFGKHLKDNVQKTSKQCKGQSIYQVTEKLPQYRLKKGDFVYLDSLHYDHLEVFSHRMEPKFVLNLDGSMNECKTSKIIGREI